MLDASIKYLDVYTTDCSDEDNGGFIVGRASFIEELCFSYECIDQLADIGIITGFDVSFWEDDNCPYCDETMEVESGFHVCAFCPVGKNTWTDTELKKWREQ